MSDYNIIFLSPHLDDAILSAGGAIWEWINAGKTILNVTILAGDAPTENLSLFAQQEHFNWGFSPEVAYARRRQEEQTASQILGIDTHHLAWQDCIYRLDEAGNHLYPTWADVIAGIHPAETPAVHALAKQLQDLPTCEQVIIPLTVGGHADHHFVQRAAELAFGADKLRYYEDFPYVLRDGSLEAVIGNGIDWGAEVVPLSKRGLEMKIAGISAYASQLSSLFDPPQAMPQLVTQFAKKRGGERFWHKKTTF